MKKLVLFVSTIVAIAFSSCSCEGTSCGEEAAVEEVPVVEEVVVVEEEAVVADSTAIVEEVAEEVVAEEAPAAE